MGGHVMSTTWLTQLIDEYVREGYLDYVDWHDNYRRHSQRLHEIRRALAQPGVDLGAGCAAVGLSVDDFLFEYLWAGANDVGSIGQGVFSTKTRQAAMQHVHNGLRLSQLLEQVLRTPDAQMHRAYQDLVAWFASLRGPGHRVSTVAIHRFFVTLLPGRVTVLFNERDVDDVGRFLQLPLSGDWFEKNMQLMEYLNREWALERLDEYYRSMFFWHLFQHLRGSDEQDLPGLNDLLGELADADIDRQVSREAADLVRRVLGGGDRDALRDAGRGNRGGNFNLIPSDVPGVCCPLLLVFSFGTADFRRRMRETIRHLLLDCFGTTRVVVFAAEEWEDAYFESEARVVLTFLARLHRVRFLAVTRERGCLVVSRVA